MRFPFLVFCLSASLSLSCSEAHFTGTSVGTAGADAAVEAAVDAAAAVDAGPLAPENSTTACTVPTLPAVSTFVSSQPLPDPFLSLSGNRIAKKTDWTCRRAEIAAEIEQYELGTKPPPPPASSVSGSVSSTDITVNVTNGTTSISFVATVTLPTTGSPPYPAMIAMNGTSLDTQALAQQGVALITFPSDDVAAEQDTTSRGHGKFYTLYGSTAPAGAMMAWAWGVSRLIDVLQTTPAANIDARRLGVTGCSRDGKGALVVGAFDERIALTIPQESGTGGAGSWRVTEQIAAAENTNSPDIQTLSEIVNENVWFSSTFSQFQGPGPGHSMADELPFDHHELEALVAPRALLVVENTISWLGPEATYTSSVAANTVWQALGVPDAMGYSENSDGTTMGHVHCQLPTSQQPDIDAFVLKYLVGGGTAATAFLKQDDMLTYDAGAWQPWTVPTLE